MLSRANVTDAHQLFLVPVFCALQTPLFNFYHMGSDPDERHNCAGLIDAFPINTLSLSLRQLKIP